jgi:hypothetical protein
MKLTHLSGNHFKVSDADAGRLVKDAGTRLPKHGYEVSVELPNGKKAWLQRTPDSSQKRRWVWAVYSTNRIVSDDEAILPFVRWGQVYLVGR